MDPSQSKTGSVPCILRAKMHKRQEEKDGQEVVRLSSLMQVDISINSENGNSPKWFEHPQRGKEVDVVCVEIEDKNDVEAKCAFNVINKWEEFHDEYVPHVMDDVFVIGYPWGISGSKGALPLYKRGCVASDPIVNFDNAPRLLVDCRTAKGMSGAPVIASHSGFWSPDNKFSDDAILGTVYCFLGIYSGRLYDQNASHGHEKEISEIGVVWKKELLDPLTNDGILGTPIADMAA